MYTAFSLETSFYPRFFVAVVYLFLELIVQNT